MPQKSKAKVKTKRLSASEYLGLSPFMMAHLVRLGRLKMSYRENGKACFKRADLDAYKNRHTARPAAA